MSQRLFRTAWPALVVAALLPSASACRKPVPFPVEVARKDIRAACRQAASHPSSAALGGDRLFAGPLLERFYERRAYEPAWSRSGDLLPDAEALLRAIRRAGDEGLEPEDYNEKRLAAGIGAARQEPATGKPLEERAHRVAELDVLLTDAFLLYAAHLDQGKVDVERAVPRWTIAPDHPALPGVLGRALQDHAVEETLERSLPAHDHYRDLRAAHAHYVRMAAERGKNAEFARRRARVLALNMERWRWLPRDLGKAHVLVDVAAFQLVVRDGGREPLRTKIVAGSEAWQTPDFTSEINQVVINPSWNAPRHVLVTELITYMRADPNYLAANKMTLLRRAGDREEALDPATVDFTRANEETIDFRLRQDPGPLNVLGRLLFRLPNKYDIFLHDTPYQEDFGKTARMYSHGCVRVQKPVDFALFLLRGERGWTRERLQASIDLLEQRVITLRRPVPTHVIYATAWASPDGRVRFVSDVYQRDRNLERALGARRPGE